MSIQSFTAPDAAAQVVILSANKVFSASSPLFKIFLFVLNLTTFFAIIII